VRDRHQEEEPVAPIGLLPERQGSCRLHQSR
jgi:hypothetical protein